MHVNLHRIMKVARDSFTNWRYNTITRKQGRLNTGHFNRMGNDQMFWISRIRLGFGLGGIEWVVARVGFLR